MVKLTEVADEHFNEEQQGPRDDDEDYVDTDSDISSDDGSDDDDETFEETMYERLVALKDMIPPKQRARVVNTVSTGYGWLAAALRFGGSSMWIISTSAIMLGVPYALAVGEEQQMIEMEKEVKAQQLASNSLSSGPASLMDQPQ
ncbi:mitochondrial outer membrane translocase complex, subunit Tom22 [Geopyxis carbonaria]|nr:mitochondrial outer membrane translocase complex, subunit Tom22 [Geopyxis carbonaria]